MGTQADLKFIFSFFVDTFCYIVSTLSEFHMQEGICLFMSVV